MQDRLNVEALGPYHLGLIVYHDGTLAYCLEQLAHAW